MQPDAIREYQDMRHRVYGEPTWDQLNELYMKKVSYQNHLKQAEERREAQRVEDEKRHAQQLKDIARHGKFSYQIEFEDAKAEVTLIVGNRSRLLNSELVEIDSGRSEIEDSYLTGHVGDVTHYRYKLSMERVEDIVELGYRDMLKKFGSVVNIPVILPLYGEAGSITSGVQPALKVVYQ